MSPPTLARSSGWRDDDRARNKALSRQAVAQERTAAAFERMATTFERLADALLSDEDTAPAEGAE
jgi:hypothetical protein